MSEMFDDFVRAAARGDAAEKAEADARVRNRTDNTPTVDPDVYDIHSLEGAGFASRNPQEFPNSYTRPGARVIAGHDMHDGRRLFSQQSPEVGNLESNAIELMKNSSYTSEGIDAQGLDGLTMLMASQIHQGATTIDQATGYVGNTGATYEQQVDAWNRAATVRQEQSRQSVDGLPASLPQLPSDRNYLAAVTLVEHALGNDTGQMTADQLVQRGLELADSFKSSIVSMNPMSPSLARLTFALRDKDSANAMLYLLDVDDRLPLTMDDVSRHATNILTDPTTYISFGAGKAAAGKVAGVGIRKMLLEKAGRTAAAGAGVGAAYGGLYDAAMQKVEQSGGNNDSYSALRSLAAATSGAVAGGVLGGALSVASSREVGQKLLRYAKENVLIPRAPWELQRGSIGVPPEGGWKSQINQRFSELPEGNIKTTRINQIIREVEKSGVSQRDMAWKGIDRLIEGRDTVPKQELMSYMQEQDMRPISYLTTASETNFQYVDDFVENYLAEHEREIDWGDSGEVDNWRQAAYDAWEETKRYSTVSYPEIVMPGKTLDYGEQLIALTPSSISRHSAFKDRSGAVVANIGHDFMDAHWNEHNILGFTRWTDRDMPLGRTRVMEEIQSDWARQKYDDIPEIIDMENEQGYYRSSTTSTAASPYRDAWPVMVLQDTIEQTIKDGLDIVALPTPQSIAHTEGWVRAGATDQAAQQAVLRNYRNETLPRMMRYLKSHGIIPIEDHIKIPMEFDAVRKKITDTLFNFVNESVKNNSYPPELSGKSTVSDVLGYMLKRPDEFGLPAMSHAEQKWWAEKLRSGSHPNRLRVEYSVSEPVFGERAYEKVPVLSFIITDKLRAAIKKGKLMPAAAASIGASNDDNQQ